MQYPNQTPSHTMPCYHWRELPQVSFMPRQMFCCDKHFFCRDKSMLVVTKQLSRKNIFVATKYFCLDKTFVTTSICRDKYNICITQVLSRQAYFCRDKHTFVATNTCLLRQNTSFVATEVFTSRQIFVAKSILSLRQKTCFVVFVSCLTKRLSRQK